MVVGAPRQIARSPALKDSLGLLLPEERLDAFAIGSGVDLRHIEYGVIAGFDLGTLYVIEPPPGASSSVMKRFRERLVGGERVETPHPDVERISGIIGETPQALVRLETFGLALAVGDPTLARIAEAFARKKLNDSPASLRGAALSQLSAPREGSLATFYAPGPFTGEWASGARGLLRDAVALRISVFALEGARARVDLELAGDFPPSASDNLAAGFRDLAESSTGRLLGLDQLEASPEVLERETRLFMRVDLALEPIARGLRAAAIADVWEIFNLPRQPDSTTP